MSRVLAALAGHARAAPDAIALSGAGQTLRYAALEGEIDAVARVLQPLLAATAPTAPAAIAMDNGPAAVILDLALIRLGRAAVFVPPFYTFEQSRRALEDCGAGLLLRAAPDGPGDFATGGAPIAAMGLPFAPVPLPRDTAKITYTSGSTGDPKGVCLSLEQMESLAAALVSVLGAEQAGTHLPLLPLAILLENVAGLYPTLMAGGRYHAAALPDVGFAQAFQPDFAKMIAAIEASGATTLILVPELLRGLLAAMVASGARLDRLTLVAVGGAKVAPPLIAAARAAGLPVYEGYGLSECASVVALNTPGADRPGTVGRPLPHLEVSVAPDGEIVVGPSPFLGYVGGPENHGPVRTGDLGEIDAEGFVRITGRRKNTIITAFGRNVAPEWVESELLAQPEIGQALVFGEAQPTLGALVVPARPGVAPAALAAAVARANGRLPDYARVERWQVTRPFDPAAGELTGNGRPRREVLLATHRDFIEAQS